MSRAVFAASTSSSRCPLARDVIGANVGALVLDVGVLLSVHGCLGHGGPR